MVVVPYMTKSGAEACAEAGISWFDLAGNASIRAPGLIVRIEGKPNPLPPRGRPSSAFSPRGARIARALLREPNLAVSQRELMKETGLSEGYVSKVVHRLETQRLLLRDGTARLRVADPDALLAAWAEDYDFKKHVIVEGHISARRGMDLIPALDEKLAWHEIDHAFTGLAAAWLMTHHAEFRVATVYVERVPDDDELVTMGFRPEPRGANTWLVVPNDPDILLRRLQIEGRPCVTEAQVWLDLRAHPERAQEAAEELKAHHLPWTRHA